VTKASFAVIECDAGFRVTGWNRVAERMFGYAASEAMGRSCLALIVPPDERERLRIVLRPLLEGREITANPVVQFTQGSNRISCEWCSAPLLDATGRPVGILSLIQDVTERVQMETGLAEREILPGKLVASSSAHIAVLSQDGVVISMNSSWQRYAWYQRNPLMTGVEVGTRYGDVCRLDARHQPTVLGAARALESVLTGSTQQTYTEYAVGSNDGMRWFGMSVATVGNPPRAIVVSHRDITRSKQFDQRVLLEAVFEHIPEGIVILDAAGRVATLNRACSAITGFGPNELIGRHPNRLAALRLNLGIYRAIAWYLRRDSRWQGEITAERRSGERFPAWLSLQKITDDRGDAVHFLGVFADITERKQAEQQTPQTYRDPLTDLPSRALLGERLRLALAKARRHGRRVAVLFLDLDRFKLINNTLGHEVGDALIRKLAERLERLVRESDTVARMSGDEYIVLLDELNRAADAARVAEKMTRMLSESFLIGGHEIFLTASIGISVFPDDANSEAALLQHADTALHRTKELGGNGHQFFAEQMNANSVERLWLETGIRRALNERQFELRYQPIVNLKTGEVRKVEALLRWCDETRGWIPPSTFIPIAEETGLILPLSEWVLNEACRQSGAWRLEGLHPITATVNFSAHQFRQPDLVSLVREVLAGSELEAEALEIELTESSLMQNPETAIDILNELKALGIRIAIDDFGTGYSSLSYLKRFPIDVVKIDRSFVSDVIRNQEDATITAAIVAMAHQLGLEVVAEGVENVEQLELLRGLGCDAAQGFYFSEAVEGRDVRDFLSRATAVTCPELAPASGIPTPTPRNT